MKTSDYGTVDQQPFFTPWIGDTYRTYLDADATRAYGPGGLCRYHLMAESHYADGEVPAPEWPGRAVRDLALQPNRYGAFWTKAIQTVENLPAWELDRAAAWRRVAYSNFMQDALTAPREAVPEAFWERGRRCFFAQLALTRPTTLVVLGKRLFANLPNEGMRVPQPLRLRLRLRPEWEPVSDAWLYAYATPFGPWLTVAVSVPHPSSGRFSRETAARRVLTAQFNYNNLLTAFNEGALRRRPNLTPTACIPFFATTRGSRDTAKPLPEHPQDADPGGVIAAADLDLADPPTLLDEAGIGRLHQLRARAGRRDRQGAGG